MLFRSMKTNGLDSSPKPRKKGAGVGIKDEGGITEEGGSTDGGIMNKGGIMKEGGIGITEELSSYFLAGGVDVATVLARTRRGKVRATVVCGLGRWEGGSPYGGTTAVR